MAAFESASSRHPGSDPVSTRLEVVEATARREAAFRVALRLVAARFAFDDFVVPVLVARVFLGAGVTFRVFAATVRFRLDEAAFFLEDVEEELFTKRTGFFAREAAVEEGFRFFDDAIV